MFTTNKGKRRQRLQQVVYHEVGHSVAAALYGRPYDISIIPRYDGSTGGCVLDSTPRTENRPHLSRKASIQMLLAGLESERIFLGRQQLGRREKGDFGLANYDKARAEGLASYCCNSPTGTKRYAKDARVKVKKLLRENWNAVEASANELLRMVDSGIRTAGGNVKLPRERVREIVEAALEKRVA